MQRFMNPSVWVKKALVPILIGSLVTAFTLSPAMAAAWFELEIPEQELVQLDYSVRESFNKKGDLKQQISFTIPSVKIEIKDVGDAQLVDARVKVTLFWPGFADKLPPGVTPEDYLANRDAYQYVFGDCSGAGDGRMHGTIMIDSETLMKVSGSATMSLPAGENTGYATFEGKKFNAEMTWNTWPWPMKMSGKGEIRI